MGFERFGRSGYLSQTKVNPLISYLEKEEIVATECKNCKRMYFPPRADCHNCRKGPVEWVSISGRAKLVTFTKVHFAPPSFENATPYLLGLAELDGDLRVFAPISGDIGQDELKPGLKLVLRPAHSGEQVYYQLDRPS